MNLIPLYFAATVLGADVAEIGWQPLSGGGMEYQVQLTPRAVDALRAGRAVRGEVPPQLKDVREYRITMGEGPLERRLPPGKADEDTTPPPLPDRPNVIAPPPDVSATKPRELPPITASKPLPETPAAYTPPLDNPPPPREKLAMATMPEPASTGPKAAPPPPAVEPEPKADDAPSKPWWPLTAALAGLFASVGLNVFLGWTTWDYRRRYQEVVSGERPVIVSEAAAGRR